MHDHQMATLISELRQPHYADMTPQQAFEAVNQRETIRRLGRTRYPDVTGFGTGVPGFPNRVRRSEFDEAWGQK